MVKANDLTILVEIVQDKQSNVSTATTRHPKYYQPYQANVERQGI